jgi:hypothetical protein
MKKHLKTTKIFTVWKWKANIQEYVGKPGIVGVRVCTPFHKDPSIFGRDGWVGVEEVWEEDHNGTLQKIVEESEAKEITED